MIGFVILLVLGAMAFAALALLGVGRALWSMAGAALMLGAAGYAWQGRPGLSASPARAGTRKIEIPAAMISLRERLLGKYTADTAYFVAADAMLRSGDPNSAALVMLGGVRKLPRSFIVWTGLGSMMAERDHQVSPAALIAFQQAARLAPEHPAPPFYLGLAYARSGDVARAERLWRRAIALSPEGASYRRDMATLLLLLERSAPRQ